MPTVSTSSDKAPVLNFSSFNCIDKEKNTPVQEETVRK